VSDEQRKEMMNQFEGSKKVDKKGSHSHVIIELVCRLQTNAYH